MRTFTSLLAFGVATVTAQQVSSASSVSSVVSSASAQATASKNASSSTSGPVTHTISVGKAGNTFSPDVLQVPVGDIIEFDFYPANHSVARAAYGYPCVPYELVLGAGYYGFWSGFQPVDAILDSPPKYSIRVNNTEPILYYCGAPGSCTGYAMVGVINPNSSTSLAHQKQLALQSTYTLVPGESWPNEASIPSGAASSSSVSPTTASTAAATTTAAAASKSSGIGPGAIAGIAIGAAAILLAGGVAIWFCGRQSRRPRTPPTAPAQEVIFGHGQPNFTDYNKHMSNVSRYGMPPGYDPRSPVLGYHNGTPIDPAMEQRMSMHGSPVPSSPPMPMYSNNQLPNMNMYAVGTHHISPVEVPGHPVGSPPRNSTEKPGVERYQ